MRSVASVCVCVCPVQALVFESLDLKLHFLVHRYLFKTFRSRSSVKVMGQGQGHASVTKYAHWRVSSDFD